MDKLLRVGLVAALLAAMSAASGCGSSSKVRHSGRESVQIATPHGDAPPVSAREAAAIKDIQHLYTARTYETALGRIASFVQAYPKSGNLPQAENLRGLIHLFNKRPAFAATSFARALETNYYNPALTPYLLYNLATAQFDDGRAEDAQLTLSRISPEAMNRENRIKFHTLKARVLAKRNLPSEAARETLEASRLLPADSNEAAEARSTLTQLLRQSLIEIRSEDTLANLYKNYEDSPWADFVLFRLGALEIADGNAAAGEEHLRALLARFPKSPHYAEASELIKAKTPGATQIVANVPVESTTVGVLLPTQGKFSKFGSRSLQAIEMAFKIFNLSEPDRKIKLVIEDSGEDGDQAVKALNRLVIKSHAVAVIGPLLSKGVEKVTQRAGELGVPLISLARSEGIANEFVFQAGLTVRLQAQEIARYSYETLGARKFAILFPRDKVGNQYSQDFWSAIEALGGQIVGFESYAPGETDFRQAVDKLSGLYYTEARSRELDELAHQREQNKIRKRTRRTEQYYSLRPVVDYDAVFIPEEPKVSGQVIPTFAYRDVDRVTFLGTSAWNSPEFPERVEAHGERSFFVDSPIGKQFSEHYLASFGEEPSAMEAIAYDAAGVLESILRAHGDLNRKEMRDRLREIKGFQGATGLLTYKDGLFSRKLKVLTIKSKQIVTARE